MSSIIHKSNMEDKIRFYATTREMGGSLMVAIPPALLQHLQIEANQKLVLITDKNKKGQQYIAIWKE